MEVTFIMAIPQKDLRLFEANTTVSITRLKKSVLEDIKSGAE